MIATKYSPIDLEARMLYPGQAHYRGGDACLLASSPVRWQRR